MHEMALIQSAVEKVEKSAMEHQFARVTKVELVVGELTAALPEAIQFCFTVAAAGTILEGACLEITEEPVQARCQDCGSSFKPVDQLFICPGCGSPRVDAMGGRELYVACFEGEK